MHSESIGLFFRNCVIAIVFALASATAAADAYEDMLAAVRAGDVPRINALLARGIDADSTDRDGSTLLMVAASAGKLDAVSALVAAKAGINARNQYGESALMLVHISTDEPVRLRV